MEIGVSTFAELTDAATGEAPDAGVRLREVVEEAVRAEEAGLDVYAVGEHHRPDFASSAPAVVLAAVAARTRRIRLSSAVTVLSSDDPVRVFQAFSTLDLLSGGRAEIMAGRGSFIESFDPDRPGARLGADVAAPARGDARPRRRARRRRPGRGDREADPVHGLLGLERIMLHVSVGTVPHPAVLRAIELLGTDVAPAVRAAATDARAAAAR